MKDLILCQDPLVEQAFVEFESGNETKLLDLVRSGYLQKKSEFAFLDMSSDYGLNSLSLNPLSEESGDSSLFVFNNGYEMGIDLPEDRMPDELLLDDIPPDHITYNKRSRASVDFGGYDSASMPDPKSATETYSHSFGSFESNDGYDVTPFRNPYFKGNRDFILTQQNEHSYPFQSSHSIPPDSMDITQQLDPIGMSMAVTEGTQMNSGGYMDTSTLTLSAESNSEERRLQSVGLSPTSPQLESQKKFIGIYSPEARKKRVQRFFEKRKQRVWTKKVKYDVRKNFADSRLRVKGRFVKKEDEELLRELMNLA
ncbi:hypothetical protein WA171_006533 [Blastocystis sp. BT1]